MNSRAIIQVLTVKPLGRNHQLETLVPLMNQDDNNLQPFSVLLEQHGSGEGE